MVVLFGFQITSFTLRAVSIANGRLAYTCTPGCRARTFGGLSSLRLPDETLLDPHYLQQLENGPRPLTSHMKCFWTTFLIPCQKYFREELHVRSIFIIHPVFILMKDQ